MSGKSFLCVLLAAIVVLLLPTPVLAESPAVTTNGADNVTSASATLQGSLEDFGTADNVTVCFEWGTSASGPYPDATSDQTKNSTGPFSADLNGLIPGTTYYYRAKAVGDGTAYGDEKSFTTLTTPPSVTTVEATGIGLTSATLNGDLDSLGTASSVQVVFEWGTDTSYGSTTAPLGMTAIGTFSAELTGISANTTYHFRAKAAGDGTTYGDELTFSTPALPPESPSDTSDATTDNAGAPIAGGETPVYSWWVLSAIVGAAVVLMAAVIAGVLFRRRQMMKATPWVRKS